MRNIKRYEDHLRESEEVPDDLDKRLIKEVSKESPSMQNVKELIDAGASFDLRDKNGWTLLHWAAFWGHDKIAGLLIDAGAKMNERTDVGWTPSDMATMYNNLSVLKLLIDAGADMGLKSKMGRTVLHLAAFHGQVDPAKLLIDAGSDVNARDKNGKTPLAVVVERHGDLVKIAGRGETVSSLGAHTRIARMLIEAGADTKTGFDSMEEFTEFFNGDVSWAPDEAVKRLKKLDRSRGAFGRF